jgi:hypothetical protein
MAVAHDRSNAVVVLGIARSGTSAVAGALAAMGVEFGQQFKPADWQNPKGNFEHAELSQLNQELLSVFGLTWSSGRLPPANWLHHHDVRSLANCIRRVIDRDFGHASLFGIKDPRLVQLWPLYSQLLRERSEISVVTVERSRDEVIQSIRRSGYLHGFAYPGRLKRLYGFYMDRLEKLRQEEAAIRIRHSELIYDSDESIGRLVRQLPFGSANIVPDIAKGKSFIDRSLHRQRQADVERVTR